MPYFDCTCVDGRGKRTRFSRQAISRERLILDLRAKGLDPIRIMPARDWKGKFRGRKKYRERAVLDFTETLGLLLSSGLPLKEALTITLSIFRRGPVFEISSGLLEKITKGASLYQALEGYQGGFPPIYRGLVKIGEKTGSLEGIFQRLAAYLKSSKLFRDRLINALIYPLLILALQRYFIR